MVFHDVDIGSINFVMVVASILSLCGCSLIVFFHFRLSIAQRNKVYNKIILYVVLSDFFAATGTIFGTEKDHTFRCSLQAFLTTAFPLSSILWTTVTFYLFYLAIRNRKSRKNAMLKMHLICWGLPLILTLLPLTSVRYGIEDHQSASNGWCFYSKRQDTPDWTLSFWIIVSFYLWVWLSVLTFSILISAIVYELNARYFFSDSDTSARLRPIVTKMIYLPIAIVVIWTVPTIYRIYSFVEDNNVYALQWFTAMLGSAKGFLTSVILVSTNSVAPTFKASSNEGRKFIQSDNLGSSSTFDEAPATPYIEEDFEDEDEGEYLFHVPELYESGSSRHSSMESAGSMIQRRQVLTSVTVMH